MAHDGIRDLAQTTIAERHPDRIVMCLVELIVGFVNLAGELLLYLAHNRDRDSDSILSDVARRVAPR